MAASLDSSNSSNPFLLLPSLVRDEIYGHIFPETRSFWLGREASAPYKKDDFRPITSNQVQFPNAFWRRRHLEHQALSHWHPPETGYPPANAPTESSSSSSSSSSSNSRNCEDAYTFLSLRLVCKQMCAEASDYMFRHGTLWWTVWNSEVSLIRDIVRIEEAETRQNSPLVGGKGKRRAEGSAGNEEDKDAVSLMSPRLLVASDDPTACMLGRYLGSEKVPEDEWLAFVRKRRDQGLLQWVGRFRNINIILQEENVVDVLEALQSILARSYAQSGRRPKVHLTICGFKLYFDQDENYWGAYLPGGKNVAECILGRNWEKTSAIRAPINQEQQLSLKKINQATEPDFWSLGDSHYWLDAFKFCSIPFKADAKYGDEALDLTGKLIFYVLKDSKMWYTEDMVPLYMLIR